MSDKRNRLRDYLDHIVEAIGRINLYAGDVSRETFLHDRMLQDAVIRNLEIIGEASRNIARHHPEFLVAHPQLPLQSAYEMRNVLANAYFEVDPDIVGRTIQNDLPGLARMIGAVVEDLDSSV